MSQIGEMLDELYRVVRDRRDNPEMGSYTNYLLNKGLDKICKKIGEESTELVVAAKNGVGEEQVGEISDLLYHIVVLMVQQGLSWDEVYNEMKKRRPN